MYCDTDTSVITSLTLASTLRSNNINDYMPTTPTSEVRYDNYDMCRDTGKIVTTSLMSTSTSLRNDHDNLRPSNAEYRNDVYHDTAKNVATSLTSASTDDNDTTTTITPTTSVRKDNDNDDDDDDDEEVRKISFKRDDDYERDDDEYTAYYHNAMESASTSTSTSTSASASASPSRPTSATFDNRYICCDDKEVRRTILERNDDCNNQTTTPISTFLS